MCKLLYETKKIVLIQNWPANSPDLNPIENVWSWIKNEVSQYNPMNVTELEKALR